MAILNRTILGCGWVFILILNNQLYAQESLGLLKKIETVHHGLLYSAEEYAGQEKTEYGYDSHNRILYQVFKERDLPTQKWEIIDEKFYSYDAWGNTSYYKWIVYQNYPDSVAYSYEKQFVYKDTLILYKYEIFIDPNWQNSGNAYKNEQTTTYTYISNIKTQTHIYKEIGYYEIPDITKEMYNYYYNNLGQLTNYAKLYMDSNDNERYDSAIHYHQGACYLGKIQYRSVGIYGFLQPIDSIQHIYSQNSCIPDTVKQFQIDYDGVDDALILKSVDTNILDANGKIIEESSYSVALDSIYYLYRQKKYEYDGSGNLLKDINTNFGEINTWQRIQEYDNNGNLLYIIEQIKDTISNDWMHTKETINDYDNKNRLISRLSEFDWDNDIQAYMGFLNISISYNQNDLMIDYEETSFGIWPHYPGGPIDYYKHIVYDDRCDGHYNTKSEWVQQKQIKENIILTSTYETNSTYHYYDIAFCEVPVDDGIKMNLFPNPSFGDLHIETSEILINPLLTIINSNGQVVLIKELSNGNFFNVNLDGLHSGIYFIQLNGGDIDYTDRVIFLN